MNDLRIIAFTLDLLVNTVVVDKETSVVITNNNTEMAIGIGELTKNLEGEISCLLVFDLIKNR